jgi:CRP/FNR family transcriptional regulator
MILQAGELLQQVLMFRSGVVSVSRTLSGGRRQVVDFLMAGDDLGVSGDDEANLTVSVLEDAEICRIPRSAVLDHVRSAGFWRGLIRLVEAATERTRDHVLILGKLRAEQRVVAFLLRYRAMSRRIQSWRSRVDLPMTRRDIADHLGMAPETVCRALAWLQDRQMIVQIPDGIRILDLQELDRLGGGRFGPTSEDESSVGRLAEGSIAALA